MPAAPHLPLTPTAMPEEELEAESPSSLDSQTNTASYSLCPRLPITYNEATLSQLQGRPQVKICNNLFIPFPSNSDCSTDNTDGNQSSDDMDDSDGSPTEVKADSSHLQIESLTAGTGTGMPTHPETCPDDQSKVIQAKHRAGATTDDPVFASKMPSQNQRSSPLGTSLYRTIWSSFQDHLVSLQDHTSSKHLETMLIRHFKTIVSYFQPF